MLTNLETQSGRRKLSETLSVHSLVIVRSLALQDRELAALTFAGVSSDFLLLSEVYQLLSANVRRELLSCSIDGRRSEQSRQ